MNKDTYYFQHDYEPTSDPKIQAMLSQDGALGYALFWRIVEMLHSDSNHRIPLKKYIFMALAQQMKTSVEEVDSFIQQCVNVYELFISDGQCLWSERVLRNIYKRNEISEKRAAAGKASAKKRADATDAQQVSTSVEQISTKERKGKEIKEKENKAINTLTASPEINIPFISFWNKYDKKAGIKKAEASWLKLTDQERVLAMDHTKKYVISKPDKQFRKDPTSYLSNKSFNDEIIQTHGHATTNGNYQPKTTYNKQAGMASLGDEFLESIHQYQGQ